MGCEQSTNRLGLFVAWRGLAGVSSASSRGLTIWLSSLMSLLSAAISSEWEWMDLLGGEVGWVVRCGVVGAVRGGWGGAGQGLKRSGL